MTPPNKSTARHRVQGSLALVAAGLTLLAGCEDTGGGTPDYWGTPIGIPAGDGGSSGATSGGPVVVGVDSQGQQCTAQADPARAVLAPERQYHKVLADLLGDAAVADLESNGELLFEVIDRPRMGTGRLDRVLRMAETAVEAVRPNLTSLLGCAALDDRTCVIDGLLALGRRAYKRPLTSIERAELETLYDDSLSADLPLTGNPTPTPTGNEPPANAVSCGVEGRTCPLPAGLTTTVWYGNQNGWTSIENLSGTVNCDNVMFGDPAPGDIKECRYEEVAAATMTLQQAREDAALLGLTALLVSPSTLYRTEFVEGPDGLGAYERAAALAALLLDSIPDESLMQAAESGTLLTEEGLDAELTRLMALPRVQQHLTEVFLHAFNVPKLFESPKDPGVYPSYTPALQVAMQEETRRVIEDVLWTRDAELSELLTTRQSFVNADLANIYGIPYTGAGDEFVPVTLPDSRAGLLTHPSLMSVLSRTDHTSVVARGLFVRGAILCAPKVPGPPNSALAIVAQQLEADATQAELAEFRAADPQCRSCHAQFDRFGLALEHFDAIGGERPEPQESVDLTGLLFFEGTVGSAAELIEKVADTPQFVDCMAERMLSYALSEARVTGSLCLPPELADSIHAGADVKTLLSAVVRHPNFLQRAGGDN